MSAPTPVADPPPIAKVATVPLSRQRLRREALALRRAAHPNVVRLVSFVDLAERTELRIADAHAATLLAVPPADGAAALTCAASLVATVADLHALGVAHRRLTADHVLVRTDGTAVLCGLSDARPGDLDADVRALAPLLELVASMLPQPGTRRDRRAVATLLAVAERALDDHPSPTAAALAADLARSRRERGNHRTRITATVAIGAAAGVGALAWSLLAGGDGSTGWIATSTTAAPTTAAPTTTLATTPTTPPPPTTAAPPTTAPPAVAFESGGATYAVGQEGDVVVTGDWDCDGVLGAALLRPANGAVFVFDRLAAAGERVSGRRVATEPGGVGLEVLEQPDGCDSLVVRTAAGGADVVAVDR